MRKQESCLEKEIMQGTMRTELPVEDQSQWEDRYKWRKYVHGVANPRIEDISPKNRRKQNRHGGMCYHNGPMVTYKNWIV